MPRRPKRRWPNPPFSNPSAGATGRGTLASRSPACSPLGTTRRAQSDILAEFDIEDRLDSSELTILREKAALERAQSKQAILKKYTAPRMQKTLALEVERTSTEERAKHARLRLEQSKERSLELQIAACTITAPADGLLVYANPPRSGLNRPQSAWIEEGATVRERQKLLSVPDLSRFQVDIKVSESQVAASGAE